MGWARLEPFSMTAGVLPKQAVATHPREIAPPEPSALGRIEPDFGPPPGPRPTAEPAATGPTPLQRRVLLGGCCLLVLGAVGGVWYFLASQSPSSAFHVGGFPGPPWRLAFWSLLLGALAFPFAWVLPVAFPTERSARIVAMVAATGAALETLALLLGAVWQTYGRQIVDPRPKSLVVLMLRLLGDVVLVATLLAVTGGLWRSVSATRRS